MENINTTTEIKEKIILIMMKYKMSNKLKKALEKFHDEIESDTEQSSYIYKKEQATSVKPQAQEEK